MTHTYLLISALPSSPSPTERTSTHPRIIIDADCTNSCLKLWGHWTESHQISIRCTEMFADYSLKSKLRSYDPFRNANVTYEHRPKIAGAWRQKLHVLTAWTLRLLDGSWPNLEKSTDPSSLHKKLSYGEKVVKIGPVYPEIFDKIRQFFWLCNTWRSQMIWLPWQRPLRYWKIWYRSIIYSYRAFIWWKDFKNWNKVS